MNNNTCVGAYIHSLTHLLTPHSMRMMGLVGKTWNMSIHGVDLLNKDGHKTDMNCL